MSTQALATLPADIAAQLDNLRDIRLPDPVSLWPLAPGWWMLAVTLACSAIVILLMMRRSRRSTQALALNELQLLRTHQTQADNGGASEQYTALLESVSTLIRRVAIQLPDGQLHAVQHGHEWSDYLSDGPDGLPREVAELLATGPYAHRQLFLSSADRLSLRAANGADHTDAQLPMTGNVVSRMAVLDAAEHWIRRHA